MIKFDDIETHVRSLPGVYEIHTRSGIALKVGIAREVRDRLKKHRASRQSGLRSVTVALVDAKVPCDVVSKSSILAKHLFFDEAIAPRYNLKTEAGRRAFLEAECYIRVEYCATRDEARRIESGRERSGGFRYCRAVNVYHRAPAR